jgi:hypothetical protein
MVSNYPVTDAMFMICRTLFAFRDGCVLFRYSGPL